jgi:hypothetical protein
MRVQRFRQVWRSTIVAGGIVGRQIVMALSRQAGSWAWPLAAGLLIVASAGDALGELPSEVLDLTHWKLTLPTPKPGGMNADEVAGPALRQLQLEDVFFVRNDPPGVVFRARCNGATTKGSKYPRCELREMSGKNEASWSTNDPKWRVLTARMAITATPRNKKHVVCAQIHDAKDDVLMLRLEDRKLLIERNEDGDVVLARDYTLGTPFDLRMAAGHGRIVVSVDGREGLDWKCSRQGCYFKAGCYTQSNEKSGDNGESYGEVVIDSLTLSAE